jgi:anti-anti-sigma regulatory factor
MASNFKILVHRNSESLHLKLVGDFDGTSAHELINTIKKYSTGIGKIFVHTSGVKKVHSFGRDIFRKSFSFGSRSINLIFTGEAGAEIAPEGCKRVFI